MSTPARNVNHDIEAEITEYTRHAKVLQRNVTSVQVIDGYDPHIKVRVADRKHLDRVGDVLGEIADAPVATTGEAAPNGYRQPPAHTFYRDDREPLNDDERARRNRIRRARGE